MFRGITLALALVISGCATHHSPNSQYVLEIVPVQENGQTRHVKYNRVTGETWWASNTTWVKIEDKEPLPISTYEVKIVPTKTSWRAIRIDTESGHAWKNSVGTWMPFKEAVEQ